MERSFSLLKTGIFIHLHFVNEWLKVPHKSGTVAFDGYRRESEQFFSISSDVLCFLRGSSALSAAASVFFPSLGPPRTASTCRPLKLSIRKAVLLSVHLLAWNIAGDLNLSSVGRGGRTGTVGFRPFLHSLAQLAPGWGPGRRESEMWEMIVCPPTAPLLDQYPRAGLGLISKTNKSPTFAPTLESPQP